ncbi:MAG TPA: transcriptional repressor [Desulfobacteraceae bacterium]|jgi:Fe2+ or Zn2+ uptake regulation protein|nr:transcriptional repressor [Desulfobacteraceae bacterium]
MRNEKEKCGRRMTKQRKVVFEAVRSSPFHPSVDEVYASVKRVLPRISLATVYRNLENLAEDGLIRRLEPEHPPMRFDGDTSEHYHITCMRCGRIEDAPFPEEDESIDTLEKALGRLTKYGVFGHKLEFIGLCSDCAEKENR